MDTDKATEHLLDKIEEIETERSMRQFQDAMNRTPVANTQGPDADTLLEEYRRRKNSGPRRISDEEAAAQALAEMVNKEMN